MIKKITVAVLITASFLAVSCNSKNDTPKKEADSNTTGKEVTTTTESTESTETTTAPNSEIRAAAIGYCDCFNQNFKTVDPKIQNIFISAAES